MTPLDSARLQILADALARTRKPNWHYQLIAFITNTATLFVNGWILMLTIATAHAHLGSRSPDNRLLVVGATAVAGARGVRVRAGPGPEDGRLPGRQAMTTIRCLLINSRRYRGRRRAPSLIARAWARWSR